MSDPHVLIVGAGPTGLMLAGVLVRQGVSVRLIERDPSPHGQARATIIQSRTLEIFQRLGIVEGWLCGGQPLRVVRSLSPEGRELRAERFEHLDTPYPFSISIQQRAGLPTDLRGRPAMRETSTRAGAGTEVEHCEVREAVNELDPTSRAHL